MRIVSWNVNGIRAVLNKDFHGSIQHMRPDILCLQETKVTPEVIPNFELDGFERFYNCGVRKGYSGTAIFSRIQPKFIDIDTQIESEIFPKEGRVILAEYDDFFLLTVYTPNSGGELMRLNFRCGTWDVKFSKFINQLDKPVIVCGDLNVAKEEIDLENPDDNHFSPGFTDDERRGIDNLMNENDLVDTFRHFYPDLKKAYSWWSYRALSRPRNVGWRIDYFLVSKKLLSRVKSAFIFKNILGSDHAPVGIDLE